MEKENSRRDFVKKAGLLTLGALAASRLPASMVSTFASKDDFPGFTLPPLPYDYSSLEPFVDTKTMEIHHGKHHQTYVDKLNSALTGIEGIGQVTLEDLLRHISKYPAAVRNNAGGHYNHSLFWKIMCPPKQNEGSSLTPGNSTALADAITAAFGKMENFTAQFSEASKNVFGSGWAWLVVNAGKKLEIGTTPNQDNPLMDNAAFKGTPILALDIWEHAYYLKHQNRRTDYIKDWWSVVNWDMAASLYNEALKK
jgi:superoxide dismutase, Fe-Mn family